MSNLASLSTAQKLPELKQMVLDYTEQGDGECVKQILECLDQHLPNSPVFVRLLSGLQKQYKVKPGLYRRIYEFFESLRGQGIELKTIGEVPPLAKPSERSVKKEIVVTPPSDAVIMDSIPEGWKVYGEFPSSAHKDKKFTPGEPWAGNPTGDDFRLHQALKQGENTIDELVTATGISKRKLQGMIDRYSGAQRTGYFLLTEETTGKFKSVWLGAAFYAATYIS